MQIESLSTYLTQINYPTGSVVGFTGQNIPYGWIICDGRSCSTTSDKYINLFNVIGRSFGGSEADKTFYLPNLSGRFVSGLKASVSTGLSGPISSWIGTTSVVLADSEIGVPSHTHTINDPGHNHTLTYDSAHTHSYSAYSYNGGTLKGSVTTYGWYDGGLYNAADGYSTYETSSDSTNVSFNQTTPSITVDSAYVAGTGHTNMQPNLAVNFIIKL